jgi:hypothetical protein
MAFHGKAESNTSLLVKAEPSILAFTDWHGQEIGEYAKTLKTVEDDNAPVVDDYIEDVISVGEPEIPGVDVMPTNDPSSKPIAKLTTKPTGGHPPIIN